MLFDLQSIINSRLGIGVALGLGRILPAAPGYRLAERLASLVAAQKRSAIVRAVRANQWVLQGGNLSSDELDRAVKAVFTSTADCLFDFYHYLNKSAEVEKRIHFCPSSKVLFDNFGQREKGVVIVGVHLSNFDLVAREAAWQGMKAMVLAYATPGKGYQWQNEIRRRAGIDLVPASPQAVRQAIRKLRKGGNVVTGVDRPLQDVKYKPVFFGRPANLPVHHIHLALAADTSILVTSVIKRADGNYQVQVSEPIQMQRRSDRNEEILMNAEKVLEVAEGMIRQAPEQWSMFFPVWPDVLPLLENHP